MSVHFSLKQAIVDSYRTGNFTLSSGRTSHEYWDVRAALLRPGALGEAVEWLCAMWWAHDECPGNLAGIGMGGAVLLGGMLTSQQDIRGALLIRDKRKGYGRKTMLEGWSYTWLRDVGPKRPLLLVDDVCTTGVSLLRAREAIWDAAGYEVPMHAAVILDRDPSREGSWALRDHPMPIVSMFSADEVRPKERDNEND